MDTVDLKVGFQVVKSESGYVVVFNGMSRPATNEEIVLWQSLEAQTHQRAVKLNNMVDTFETVITNPNDMEAVEKLFTEHKSAMIFTTTAEIARIRKLNGELSSKLAGALGFIHRVAIATSGIEITELLDEDTKEVLKVISNNGLLILKQISEQCEATPSTFDFPLHQRLSDLTEKVSIATRIAQHIVALAEADCQALLTKD